MLDYADHTQILYMLNSSVVSYRITYWLGETYLGEAEKELLRVSHVESRQQIVIVMIGFEPCLKGVIADLQATIVSYVLTQCRPSLQLDTIIILLVTS